MRKFSDLFEENKFTPEDVPAFENKLFFEGERRQPYLVRFTVLLLLSTIIATYGVINGSTATVIGAMIIAPLMTPIMAEAASIVMGQRNRAITSFLLVVFGVALVIAISALIGWLESLYTIVPFSDNPQVTSRISPRITDLAIALASGAAGAFAMSRDDVADSLPGVSISISLVPPLCVVGVGLALGEWAGAWGAFLLFLTNYLSILFAGGLFLAFLGLEKSANVDLDARERRRAFTVILVAVVLISIPLLSTSIRAARDASAEFRTSNSAQEWISGSQFDLRNVRAQGEDVSILIAGEGEPPPISDLVDQLQEKYNSQRMLDVQIIPLQHERRRVIPTDE